MAAAVRYVNPLAKAKVTGERIDQGVDYAGTGSLAAIGPGVVTQVATGPGTGWPGNFLEYQITDGPLKGQNVYYAEGVTPLVKVGQKINGGDVIANLIPGWHSGVELGFGSGQGTSTYAAAAGGGYREGYATAAGEAFSQVVQDLGGIGGKLEGPVMSQSSPPPGVTAAEKQLDTGPGLFTASADSPIGAAAGVVGGAIDAGAAFAGFVSNPVPVLLTVGVVLLGALMIFSGTGKLLGFDTPLRSAASRVKSAAKAGAAAA